MTYETTNYKVAWKRGIAVLSAGSFIVSPDNRLRLVRGFDLEIQNVEPQDAGDYVCQIGMRTPREISHTLEILACAIATKE
ncbi:hypothetical protein J437_LFUL008599 [Ladona fulva]|uniref:Ig-like domain-containing protein n=1 Tax=Ladona fulva TaxID=123851 RepID=A0A8K0K789_LADFU|nr:hypothetical protein J437_LFUL008599 [Ladona fulva]